MSHPSDQTRNVRSQANVGNEYRDPYNRPDQAGSCPIGISESGPAMAIRTQSVRHVRRTVCLAMIAFTIGSLVIVLNSPVRHGFLAPGPLTNSHAQILGGVNPDRCKACHESGGQSVSQWLAGTLTGDRGNNHSSCQSDLCLKCHQESLESGHPMNPHGVPTNQLAAITQRALTRLSDGKTIQVSAIQSAAPNEISCNDCHREHHGGQFDLAAMTDRQCQVCHTSTFHRFDLDHPAFAVASNSDDATLNFDHFAHGTRHFAGANRSFDCKSCHPADISGRNRTTAGFETACASCHNSALVDSQSRGIELISLPVLDIEAIRGAGLSVGHWPANATGDFDGRLPPAQRLLLAADPELQQLVNKLPDEFQFSDIDPGRPEDLRLAANLAAGYLRLFREISDSGKSAVIGRMTRVAQTVSPEAQSTIEKIFAELDDARLRQTVKTWVAEPATTIPVQGSDDPPLSEIELPKNDELTSSDPESTAGELLVENPVAGMLPIGSDPSKSSQSGQADFQATGTQPAPTEAAEQQSLPDLRSSLDIRRSDSIQQAANDWPAANLSGELLSRNPLNSIEFRGPTRTEPAQVDSSLASDTEPSEYLAESRSHGNASPKQAANRPDQLPADGSFFSPVSPAVLMTGTQWKTDHNQMIISWQPTGHADPGTRSILEWIATANSNATPNPGMVHFAWAFESSAAPGQCALCHRRNQSAPDANRLAWKSFSSVDRPKGFTRFDHGPHTLIANCETCHSLDESAPGKQGDSPFRLASWKQSGEEVSTPPVSVCGLNPVTANDCASCHRPNAAPGGCTTCHNYHVSNSFHYYAPKPPLKTPAR